MRSRVAGRRGRDLGLLAILLVAGAFYVWTAAPGGSAVRAPDRYNEVTDAFEHGQIALLQEPSAGLKAVADPYDPAQNEPYRVGEAIGDLSYFHGHLYAYWGPTPVLLLFWPARAFGGHVSESAAMDVFSILGLIALLALLRMAVVRWAPRAPAWMEMLAAVALALCTLAPYNLRNPGVYQTAIAAGVALLFVGIWALAGALRGGRDGRGGRGGRGPVTWLLAVGSLALGLAGGARPPMFIAGAAALGFAGWRLSRTGRRDPLLLAALAVPFVACVVAQGIYNDMRFDSFTEFGQRYLITGPELTASALQRPANVAPGLFFYLVAPLHLTSAFPFMYMTPIDPGQYPGTLPPHYTIVERTAGVLWTQPFLLLLVAAFALPWLRRALTRPLRSLLAVAGLVVVALLVADAYAVPGTTMRYETDFLGVALLAGLVAWIVMAVRLGPGPLRTAVRGAGALLLGFGMLVGLALSISGYEGVLEQVRPATFDSLARFFSSLGPIAAKVAWSGAGGALRALAELIGAVAAVGALTWALLSWRGAAARPGSTLAAGRACAGAGALAVAVVLIVLHGNATMSAGLEALLLGGLALVVGGLTAASYGKAA